MKIGTKIVKIGTKIVKIETTIVKIGTKIVKIGTKIVNFYRRRAAIAIQPFISVFFSGKSEEIFH